MGTELHRDVMARLFQLRGALQFEFLYLFVICRKCYDKPVSHMKASIQDKLSTIERGHCKLAWEIDTALTVSSNWTDFLHVRQWFIAEGYTKRNIIRVQKSNKMWYEKIYWNLSLLAILELERYFRKERSIFQLYVTLVWNGSPIKKCVQVCRMQ